MKPKSKSSRGHKTKKEQAEKVQTDRSGEAQVNDEQVLRVSQAAKLKGVSRTAIYDAIKRGDLRSVPVRVRKGEDQAATLSGSLPTFVGVRLADLVAWTPLGHKHGRPEGVPMTEAAKANISQGQKRRWAQRKDQSITQDNREIS